MTPHEALRAALDAPDPSARLQAALTAGTTPRADYIPVLIEQCAVESDFFVRDMLTWALTRHDPSTTIDGLLPELRSATPQARSQALHTLSKIGDRRTWTAITRELLDDPDDGVARTAWRAAAALVADGHEAALADSLAHHLGRGDREMQRSLSRAFAVLGPAAAPAIDRAANDPDLGVRAHALATRRIIDDPDEDFDAALAEAHRSVAHGDEPPPEAETAPVEE
jgi:HEAT repeat protein